MKLARVLFPVIAVTAMVLGGTFALAAESKVKIGVTLAMFDDVFITNVRDAMTKWAKAHPEVELTIVDAAGDTAKQVGQVENFLAQGMDAVVILPVDTTATGPMTKGIVKAGKPLVYVNRKPENLPKGVVYVGSKSIDAGVMNMEELGKAMGGKGNLAILIGELSDEPAHGFTQFLHVHDSGVNGFGPYIRDALRQLLGLAVDIHQGFAGFDDGLGHRSSCSGIHGKNHHRIHPLSQEVFHLAHLLGGVTGRIDNGESDIGVATGPLGHSIPDIGDEHVVEHSQGNPDFDL